MLVITMTNSFAKGVNIAVTIDNFKNKNGQVLIAIHNNPKAFPTKPNLAVQKIILPLDKDAITYTFSNIEPGEYAVTSVHDENNNEDLDKSFFGKPKEGYGCSNGARGIVSPPSFNHAKFTVNETNKAIYIKMIYPLLNLPF